MSLASFSFLVPLWSLSGSEWDVDCLEQCINYRHINYGPGRMTLADCERRANLNLSESLTQTSR